MRKTAEDDQVGMQRRLVVDAALALAVAERRIPTLEGLAEKTGFSVGKITALFPTLDDLGAEIRSIAAEVHKDLDDAMPSPDKLDIMLAELVDLRAKLYETVGELRQLGDAAEQFLPSIAQAKAIREGRYRAALATTFADHFDEPNSEILSQIELITSWDSWRHLRTVQCLSVDQARKLIRSMLTAVASAS